MRQVKNISSNKKKLAFPDSVVNDDLKKFSDHPVILRKMQRGMEMLAKAGIIK
jgi:hypothetical protein